MLTANTIRKKYLDFFKSKGHSVIASDSIVPKEDTTVLFTTAGMQQFKKQFLGYIEGYTRATTSQKCLRTDDLDQVGKTAFHHTFFEMLGNFSFGDYFKKEAIHWAWEFLTKEIKLSPDRLWVSVYKDDDEAEAIWINDIKLDRKKVVRLGDKSNFWPSDAKAKGPNGPCGPCSEIFFDYGVNPKCTSKVCDPSCDCGRFSEIWNLVFTQFNRKEGGILEPLPSKNIDTGMGLERLTAVVQGKSSNFETDLFSPILQHLDRNTKGLQPLTKTEKHIIADHIRAVTFGISDGVIPSNEGRGYVMRRLIVESADILVEHGAKEALFFQLTDSVVEIFREPYPEIVEKSKEIAQIIRKVEEAYLKVRTERLPEFIKKGKQIVTEHTSNTQAQALGELFFYFRDTHGLTLPTILKSAQEHDFFKKDASLEQAVLNVYNDLMERQKAQARASSKMTGDVFVESKLRTDLPKTEFVGYSDFECSGKVLAIITADGQDVKEASCNAQVKIILDKTPFYAESGGQVGDVGYLTNDVSKVRVSDTQKFLDIFMHTATIEQGTIKVGDTVQAQIDANRRLSIMRNHTSTHLLQWALREVLGAHVRQQGSLVAEDRLRFDFTHPQAITKEQINRIEALVNEHIYACDPVGKQVMNFDEAQKSGALAFFEEKYGNIVRVISIGNYSKEFCGGTHLDSTGQIGMFKILSESAVAQGIRRLEATTGTFARQYMQRKEDVVQEIAAMVKSSPAEVTDKIKAFLQRTKELEQEVEQLRFTLLKNKVTSQVQALKAEQKSIFSGVFENTDIKVLRQISDYIRQNIQSIAVVLGSKQDENVYILITVTDDLVGKGVKANDVIQEIVPFIKGSGGGKPQMAQAGSKDASQLQAAVEKAKKIIEGKLA